MAWQDMTPHGRGYSSALTYFDYDTDFWTEAKPMCGTSKAKLETVECVHLLRTSAHTRRV